MFTRDRYKPETVPSFISIKNEPSLDKTYPNMYNVYTNFSNHFSIPINNFILTNGCENALKIAMMMLSGKDLYIEHPSWAMVDVIAEGFGFNYTHIDYTFRNDKFILNIPDDSYPIYTTDTYSNLIKHENIDSYRNIKIIDETYTNRILLNKDRILTENEFIIGSFSKCANPALRLGYLIYHEKYDDRAQLLREQYICGAAANYLENIIMHRNPIWDWNIPYEIITHHYVYVTLQAKELPIPHKHFIVAGIDLCRFGNPDDNYKKEYIEWKLNTSNV